MEKILGARKFMKHYGLEKTGLSVESLTKIARSMGYDVSCFNPNCKEHIDLLNEIRMQEYAKTNKAFTYAQGNKKIIFIFYYSSERDKTYLLLHEIAHLYLNHMYDSSKTETEKEEEANKFAHYVMQYKTVKNIFTYSIASIILVTLFITSTVTHNKIDSHATSPSSSPVVETIQSISPSPSPSPIDVDVVIPSEEPAVTPDGQESVMVSVTKSGDKYHLPDCHYIAGRTVFTLSIEEARNAGYTACTYCRPDEK